MKTFKDDFSKSSLDGWTRENVVLPDVMPYYPRRPVNLADWKVSGGVLEATSKQSAWSYLLRGDENDGDYTLEFDMMVPAMSPDRVEYFGNNFTMHRPGEFEPCWETAAVVRHTGRDNFYRIQMGALAGGTSQAVEGALALWSPAGGFLQVVPYALKPFTWRKLKVVCCGPVIEVWLDGEPAIHYKDTVAPNLTGKCGLGVAGTQFYRFANASLRRNSNTLPAEQATQPGKGKMNFHVQWFLHQQFLFCNNEPIARLEKDSTMLYDVVLRPGYKPGWYFGLHWDQYNGNQQENYTKTPEQWIVEKSGGSEFVLKYRFRNMRGNVTCNGRLSVSYDRKLNSYAWDVDTTLAVAKGTTWRNEHKGLSFSDPIAYDTVAPSIDVKDPWPCPFEWIVFQSPDRKYYRHPMFHEHVPDNEHQMSIKSDGGLAAVMNNPLSNPAIEFNFKDTDGLRPGFWLCPWSYDIHFLINPYRDGYKIPGGTRHRVKYRYISLHGKRAQEIFEQSTVHPYFKTLPRRVLFTAGVNSFEKTTKCDLPHREYFWEGGRWDQQVGRGDNFSMRLTNKNTKRPKTAHVNIGGSMFMGRFDSKSYTLTAWVKTDSVRGKGVRLFARNGDVTVYSEKALTGTGRWRKLTLKTEILYGILSATIGIELEGTGTAWLDDFELSPLGER